MFYQSVRQALRWLIYLLIVFGICRTVFLLSFVSHIGPKPVSILWQCLTHALPLDLSTIGYLLILPVASLAMTSFIKNKGIAVLVDMYMMTITALYVLITIVEIAVYRELNQKLYYSLFAHVYHPDEIIQFITPLLLSTSLIAIVSMLMLSWWLYIKLAKGEPTVRIPFNGKNLIQAIFFTAFSGGLLVLCIRGGWQPIPINEGVVCFSTNQVVNDAAINPLWNLGHSYIETKNLKVSNQYMKLEKAEAASIVNKLYSTTSDSTTNIFNTSRPNICFIILEGWHSDVIRSLGGYDAVAPNFEKLIQNGYLFTNFYSSGHISDQGVAAILSGFPALTLGSVINQTEKQYRLPCLGKDFLAHGYHTSFLYGGQLEYGGIKHFVYQNKFQTIREQNDYSDLPQGKLGVHDSLMFKVWGDSLRSFREPFFSCLYTLSTHTPYDMDTYNPIAFGADERDYLNSVAYADRQIGLFFEEAKKLPWYSNTIFVLVADHGHHTPNNYEYDSKEHYHIPMLIIGGALKPEYAGKQCDHYGTLTDIAATILGQMGIKNSEYRWSKNLLNPTAQSFAFYTFNDGYGFIDSTGFVKWNKRYTGRDVNTAIDGISKTELQKKGDAHLQMLMQHYLEL